MLPMTEHDEGRSEKHPGVKEHGTSEKVFAAGSVVTTNLEQPRSCSGRPLWAPRRLQRKLSRKSSMKQEARQRKSVAA